MTSDTTKVDDLQELDWIDIQNIKRSSAREPFLDRLVRKTKENPFVPIGVSVTVGALVYGVYSMYHDRRMMSQYMMRLRVGAQAFTVVAMVTGLALSINKKKAVAEEEARQNVK